MRIISLNLNGIRSAAKKGFYQWLETQNADIVCLQETRAQINLMPQAELFHPAGYYCYFHDAEKKGYSGVGLYTKIKPVAVKFGLGWEEADKEGRYVEADFGHYKVASIYLPSGTSGDHRQAIKFDFMRRFMKILNDLQKQQEQYIICGDWNIAHKPIDLKNWKANQKNTGFLPEERAWMEELFTTAGFVDAFREMNKEALQYTWWSNRGQSWANNIGWRIDYQVVTSSFRDKIANVCIYKEQRFSDHAPLIIDYDL